MAAIKDVDRLNDVAGVASSYEPKHGWPLDYKVGSLPTILQLSG
ncbi:hypothetical protein [Desulfosarcina ovata]|nr:hypothetical protein [Desulfosarcina ovata]